MERGNGIERRRAGVPDDPACAACGAGLAEPFGWCSNCQEAYCQRCRWDHYCCEGCREAGCFAGLCVRTVDRGELSRHWEAPPVGSATR